MQCDVEMGSQNTTASEGFELCLRMSKALLELVCCPHYNHIFSVEYHALYMQ